MISSWNKPLLFLYINVCFQFIFIILPTLRHWLSVNQKTTTEEKAINLLKVFISEYLEQLIVITLPLLRNIPIYHLSLVCNLKSYLVDAIIKTSSLKRKCV